MDFASVLTAVAGLTAAVLGYLQANNRRRSHEKMQAALVAAREHTVERALREGDLKILGEYFFEILGRLPLSEYAEDSEARRIVSGAVRNVEGFVNADRPSIIDDPELLPQVDARRAESDLLMGDIWGGLSRLRRLIEASLRQVASEVDMPVGRMGANQILQRLVRAETVSPQVASVLRRAIAICNRGVHGEPVSGEEAEEALALAAEGLAALRRQE